MTFRTIDHEWPAVSLRGSRPWPAIAREVLFIALLLAGDLWLIGRVV